MPSERGFIGFKRTESEMATVVSSTTVQVCTKAVSVKLQMAASVLKVLLEVNYFSMQLNEIYFATRISLSTMTLVVESPQVYTQLGVAISVTGIAQVHKRRQ